MKNSPPSGTSVFSQPLIESKNETEETMQARLTKIIEEMQQRARTCETVAQDSTEEALTGEPSAKEKNTQDANEWMLKSKVWLEAEAVVRGFVEPTEVIER
jgi:guanylate kinase